MNAVAAVGIFLIVGTVGTRMIVFMKEADRQLTKDAGGEAYYSADLPPDTVEEAIPEDLPGMPPSLQPAPIWFWKKMLPHSRHGSSNTASSGTLNCPK